MVVPASLPVPTVQGFIDYAKARPGQLSMASSGVGASPHLTGELFKYMTGIDMVHVPYRGAAAAYPDLITGKVHMLFDNLKDPDVQARLQTMNAIAVDSAPEQFDAVIRSDAERYGKLLRAAGVAAN